MAAAAFPAPSEAIVAGMSTPPPEAQPPAAPPPPEALAPAEAPARPRWLRALPLAVLLAGFVAFLALGGYRYVSLDQVREHRGALMAWVAQWGVLAALAYVFCYAVMAACSVPGATVASLLSGFLFGLWGGAAVAVAGATLGAVVAFLAARTAFGDGLGRTLRRRAGPRLRRMEEGFRNDAFSYLLVLRLVPVFPFWLVNIVPALAGVRLRPYVLATVIGIVPGALVYAGAGSGLGALLDQGARPNLKLLFEWHVLLPILGLAVLALLPVVLRRRRRRGAAAPPAA